MFHLRICYTYRYFLNYFFLNKPTSAVARAHNPNNNQTVRVQPLTGHNPTLAMTSRHKGAKPSLPPLNPVPIHAVQLPEITKKYN